jgi:hypothetical protein
MLHSASRSRGIARSKGTKLRIKSLEPVPTEKPLRIFPGPALAVVCRLARRSLSTRRGRILDAEPLAPGRDFEAARVYWKSLDLPDAVIDAVTTAYNDCRPAEGGWKVTGMRVGEHGFTVSTETVAPTEAEDARKASFAARVEALQESLQTMCENASILCCRIKILIWKNIQLISQQRVSVK